MTDNELLRKYPETFAKIGAIILNLNRIEGYLITGLSIFFADFANPNSEKTAILNDALFDDAVFPTLENKRCFLIKVIKHLWRVAEEYGVPFEKDRFLAFCKSVTRVQEIRNDLGHHQLGFLPDGRVQYSVRKSDEQRVHEQKNGIRSGTMKPVDIDLEKELTESQKVLNEAEAFLVHFIPQARAILQTQNQALTVHDSKHPKTS